MQSSSGFAGAATWPGISYDSQVAKFGASHAMEPPDTQVAVGPNSVIEMVNDTASVFTKTGSDLLDLTVDSLLLPDSGYYISDPRVLYDASSGRFFASAMGIAFDAYGNPTGSEVLLAVSQTSDPTGAWNAYQVLAPSTTIADQPKLGTADGVITLAWNSFDPTGAYLGAGIAVEDKSQLLAAAATIDEVGFGPNPALAGVTPAQALGATSTAYLIANNAPSPTVELLTVTGTPSVGDVALSQQSVGFSGTSVPPSGHQPSGNPVDTGDDRFTSAVWRDGQLWTGGNDACSIAGAVQSCLHVLSLTTNGTGAASVLFDEPIGLAGTDLYYPAVTLDGLHGVLASFSYSSPSLSPAAAVLGWRDGSSSVDQTSTLLAGASSYAGTRWGDYSGIAVDPTDATKVFAAAEYVAASSSTVADIGWGTAIGSLSLDRTVPVVSFTQQPPANDNHTATTFAFTASDPDDPSANLTYTCYLDSSTAASACTSPDNLSGLAQGTHWFAVVASDPAGNQSDPVTVMWRVDTAAPTITVLMPSSSVVGSTSPEVPFSVTDAGDPAAAIKVTCALDGAAPQSCSPPGFFATSLAEGWHRVDIHAVDLAGNSADASVSFRVDTSRVTLEISSAPGFVSNTANPTFGFVGADSDGDPVSFVCSLDGAPATPCASSVSYSALPDGPHALVVTAQDQEGAVSVYPYRWTVDTAPPVVRWNAPAMPFTFKPNYLAFYLRANWTGTDATSRVADYDVRYRQSYAGGGFSPWVNQGTGRTWFELAANPGFDYCVQVRARDQAGWTSAWTVPWCTAVPLDDLNLASSGTWTRHSHLGFFGTSYTVTNVAGSALTRPRVSGRRFGLLATRCPTCGTVAFYVGGHLLKTINLYAPKTQYRWLASWVSGYQAGTLTIRVVSHGKLVQIDGIGVSRT